MKNLKIKAFSGAKWNLVDIIITNTINFLILAILSQNLTPSDFGLIAVLAFFIALSEVIINSGFSQALIQKNKNVTKIDCDTAFTVSFLISLFVYGLFFIFSDTIANFYNLPELSLIIKIMFVSIIINTITIVPRALVSIKVDFKSQALISICSVIVAACCSIYLVKINFSYWALVSIPISKSLITSMLYIFFSKWKPKLLISIKSFNQLFSFGGKLLLAGIFNALTINLNLLVIGKFLNIKDLGFYNQSQMLSGLLANNIINITQKISFTILSSVKTDSERLTSIYKRVLSASMFISFPILFGFASVSNEFILIFLTDDWIDMSVILVSLCISRAISPVSILNMSLISAIGRSDLILKVDMLKLPVSLSILMLTIPYGINYIAYGQIANALLFFIMNSYFTGKLFNLGLFFQIKILFPMFLSSLMIFLINKSFYLHNLYISLFVKIILGIFIYYSICTLLKVEHVKLVNNKFLCFFGSDKNK